MTLIEPARSRNVRTLPPFVRKVRKPVRRPVVLDEDGLRSAYAFDGAPTAPAAAGSSLECLARLALG